jgi:hypothetical protein
MNNEQEKFVILNDQDDEVCDDVVDFFARWILEDRRAQQPGDAA